MSKEYTEGQNAFNENKGRHSCPYEKGSQKYIDFVAGWDQADNDFRASNMNF